MLAIVARSVRERPLQLEADHVGDQHRLRLPEERGLGLDSADAPAEDAQSVDHHGVAVGPDEGVGVGDVPLPLEDDAGEVLQVDLVADPRVGRNDAEVTERVLPPPEEGIPLPVPVELELRVRREGLRRGELIDDDRVVDDEIRRGERVDLVGVSAHLGQRLAHRGEVDDGRDAREVLEEDARRAEGDLAVGRPLHVARGERLDVLLLYGSAVLVPEQVLEEDPE
jgi:hypothetical protein